MRINFCIYADSGWKTIPLTDLIAHASKYGDLWARAENSGNEGVYVEVARWNQDKRKWLRYCFKKFFGGEDMEPDQIGGWDAWPTAERIAARINVASGAANAIIIHTLPNWE